MKNDDGRPDFELVWKESDSFVPPGARIVGVNVHPRAWYRLFAAAIAGPLLAGALAVPGRGRGAVLADLPDAVAEAATNCLAAMEAES